MLVSIKKIIKLFINNLICESIVSGIVYCISNPTNCGAQFSRAEDVKRFTNYNWAPKSAAAYTARPTFSLFDICNYNW